MSATRQHRPIAELRAIQPTPARGIVLTLPEHRTFTAEEAAAIGDNFAKYGKANWRGPNRAVRRQYGVSRGPGFQRLNAAGRHIRGAHAPSHRPAQPEEALAA